MDSLKGYGRGETVTLPTRWNGTTDVPKPAMDLKAGLANYKASIAAGGQTIPLSMRTETKEENGAWVVTETAVLPQGEISDTSTIEKGSLLLRHRSVKQGPMVIELDVKGNKASGTMTMNGQSKPIDADLGGILFADGAGAFDVIAALTAAGTVRFRNSNCKSKKQATVKGREQRGHCSCGNFDATGAINRR